MNKGQQFWLDMWRHGDIPFHKYIVNTDLMVYWPQMNLARGATVLVPLCGKSLDMMWLYHQGFKVIGIELSELAVQQFAEEQQLFFKTEVRGNAVRYFIDSLEIWVSDFFDLECPGVDAVDAIYDRASLIALPESLRLGYVEKCLSWLKPDGGLFLITMHYDEHVMQGPPFSITDKEVFKLYFSCKEVNQLKTIVGGCHPQEPLYQKGLREVTHSVWIMKR